MKLIFIISVFVFSVSLYSTERNIKENIHVFTDTTEKCPVTQDAVSGEYVTFRYINSDIKFCNEGCIMAFKKEPAKYSEHLFCMPCSDPDGNKETGSVYNGVKYYFCSESCKGKFDKEPDVYLEKFKK